jgi:hypothetical protein
MYGVSFGFLGSVLFVGWHISIMVLLIIGVALYVFGYLRQETTINEAKMIIFPSVGLIIWGALNYVVVTAFNSLMIVESMQRDLTLTFWGYMEYWVWELKAILWVATGVMLIVTSLVQIHLRRNQNIQESQKTVSSNSSRTTIPSAKNLGWGKVLSLSL